MKAVVHQSGYTLKLPRKLKNNNNSNNKQMKTNNALAQSQKFWFIWPVILVMEKTF